MSLFDNLIICLRFFSRLPLPVTTREEHLGAGGLAGAVALVPIAGAIVGALASLALLLGLACGLPSFLASAFAVATLVVVTGALHEDGLADCADGFGGGRTRDRKLEIMRDSRIGTFGACALALSLYVRIIALGLLAARAPALACMVLVSVASLSRTASLLPLLLLPPARPDGLGASAGRPTSANVAIAAAQAVAIALATLPFGTGIVQVTGSISLAAAAGLAVSALAWRQIHGQTGDVAGAAQQLAEVLALLAYAANAS